MSRSVVPDPAHRIGKAGAPRLTTVVLGAVLALSGRGAPAAQAPSASPSVRSQPFEVVERSISELRAALEQRQVTSRQLVEHYLARIEAYDQAGPAINAFITLNRRALATADALDTERRVRGSRGPLHGIPVVVKDNFDTADMPTTGGSIALATLQPARDAFHVARLRRAGAIILGKTNLQELAAGIVTVSSLGGQTKNPYDPTRNPGGSSGGTGAAIAANFAAAGLGTDTCGSIRIPASHNSLVGLRPTAGLSSRAGVIPLSHTQDVAGPLARSVKDVALLLDATAGIDPADPTTAAGRGHVPRSYLDGLDASPIAAARVGVLPALFGDAPEDREVANIVRAALDRMKAQGAIIVDVAIPNLTELLRNTSVIDAEFKFDLADYLAPRPAPVGSLGEIIEKGLYHQALDATFRRRNAVESKDSESYRASLARREEARKAVLAGMNDARVIALVYPTIRRQPAVIGEAQGGSNCQLSPTTGFPALSVPAGFTADGLPVGIEFVGRPFSEPALLRLGAALERTAKIRRPPPTTPALPVVARDFSRASPAPLVTRDFSRASVSALRTTFRWDGSTGRLGYEVAVEGVTAEDVLLVALHRAEPGQVGPSIARLLRSGALSGRGDVTLRPSEREDLQAGRLYVQLFTRQEPFGTARAAVVTR